MLHMVIGGAGSGKSQYAEDLLQRVSCREKIYIATMEPAGEEARRRISRHRFLRRDKGFLTVERPLHLAGVQVPKGAAVLVECLGNLAANELYSPRGAGDGAVRAILDGVDALCAQAAEVIIVANDVFSDGVAYEESIERYLRVMAGIVRILAQRSSQVVEVVCGIPVIHKANGQASGPAFLAPASGGKKTGGAKARKEER